MENSQIKSAGARPEQKRKRRLVGKIVVGSASSMPPCPSAGLQCYSLDCLQLGKGDRGDLASDAGPCEDTATREKQGKTGGMGGGRGTTFASAAARTPTNSSG